MEIPTFLFNVLPSNKKEENLSKRKIRVIKEFLKKRKNLEIAKKHDASHLKQLRKSKSIDASTYRRLKKLMSYNHERKRIDLITLSIEKSVKVGKSFTDHDNQPVENDQQAQLKIETNWEPMIAKAF